MKNEIRYYWGDDHLLIALGRRIDYRVRTMFLLEFLILSGVATSFLLQAESLPVGNSFFSLATCSGILYLIAISRIFSRLYYSESIRLDQNAITQMRHSAVAIHIKSQPWDKISGLRYQQTAGSLPDPRIYKRYLFLSGKARRQISEIKNSSRLYLETDNGRFYFASGINAENAIEIASMMKLYSGIKLSLGPELTISAASGVSAGI